MWQLGGEGAWAGPCSSTILALEPRECSLRGKGWGLSEVSGAWLALSPDSVCPNPTVPGEVQGSQSPSILEPPETGVAGERKAEPPRGIRFGAT